MMYAPPVSEEELDSYSEINLMPKPSGYQKPTEGLARSSGMNIGC
jgi:hypothetical protein